MANAILLKRSATPSKVPSTVDLQLGELALNTYDGTAYFKKNDGTDSMVQILTSSSNNTVANGHIVPSLTQTYDLGSPSLRWRSIYVDTAYLAVNTLYLGNTPILGTSAQTVNIHADPNQSIDIATNGTGTTTLVSAKGVNITTTGINANVTFNATGAGSNVQIGATNEVQLSGTAVSITAPVTVASQTVTGNLTVTGNFTVNGSVNTVNSTTVTVADNIVVYNYGQVGSGVSAGLAGLQIDRGDLTDYQLVFDESDDMFKLGAIGSLQTIASQPWVSANYSVNTHNHTIDGLSNVTIVSKASNDYLKWNGSAWVNSQLPPTGVTISNDTTTNSTFYIPFVSTASGTVTSEKVSSSQLTYNPSTNTLTTGVLTSTSLLVSGTTPGLTFIETDQGLDLKRWLVVTDGQTFQLQTRKDDISYLGTPLTVTRGGTLTTYGIRLISAGTAAAPIFYINNDSNTGMYSPGTDQIGFSTGGSTALTLDASGNAIIVGNTTASSFISSNTIPTSSTTGAIVLSGSSGAIVMDDGGHKRISWNDNAGNFNIRSGNYHNGTNLIYAKGSGDSNSGAAAIVFNSDNVDGSIVFTVAPIGVPGATISSWSNTFGIYSSYTQVAATANATSTTTGALRVTGGLGVGADIYSTKYIASTGGSISAPVIRINNDNNTGIYSPGTDQIGFTTAGTAAMTLDSAGNTNVYGSIGIKNASPSAAVAINSNITLSGNQNITGINSYSYATQQTLTAARSWFGAYNFIENQVQNNTTFSSTSYGCYNNSHTTTTAGFSQVNYGELIGCYNNAYHQSDDATYYHMQNVFGSYNRAQSTGDTSNIAYAYGTYSRVDSYGTAASATNAISNAFALYGYINAGAANRNITNAYGLYLTKSSTGSFTGTTYSIYDNTGWDARFSANVSATNFTSTVATGTAPFTVSSTTKVTNLNADLLDGYTATATNTIDTVVLRNSAGDISCRLVKPEYANQTTISGAIAYRINNTTDNYIRFCSDMGAVRTFIGANNASNLTTGTLPDGRFSGSYTGMTNLTGSGTVDFSKFYGNTGDSAGAPSFSWTTDTNTGMYSPGADQCGITCGGVIAANFTTTYQANYGHIYIFPADNIAANATTTTRDSGYLYSRGHYWNGSANAVYDWGIFNDITSNSPLTSYLRFTSGGVTRVSFSHTGVVYATTFSGSGSSLTSLNASNISSGTVPTARLGSGTANNTTYLRGDNTWQVISTSGLGEGQSWQNVTASRSVNVTYTNTTGKPIQIGMIKINATNPANGVAYSYSYTIGSAVIDQVSGNMNSLQAGQATILTFSTSLIVPPGETYIVSISGYTGVSTAKWFELR